LEHWMETICHGLFSKKKSLKSDSWIQIHEMKLRSTSSAEENFPDKITWITWKNLEIWQFLKSILEKRVWESGPKIDPATGVNCEQIQLLFFFNFSPNFFTNFFLKVAPFGGVYSCSICGLFAHAHGAHRCRRAEWTSLHCNLA
jgi:hypothetical protein